MMKKGFIPVILIAVLTLVIAVGGVGIGLAWKTNRLDKWLPPNIREMFGRGEKPEEEAEEGAEEEPAEEPEEKPEEKPKPKLPGISEVAISNIGETSFTVTWKTAVPATSRVEYGKTTSYGAYRFYINLVTQHSLTPNLGLVGCTTYHYRVISKDAKGNEASSADSTFTTACWKTYENEFYGISFKYPKTYQITEELGEMVGGELVIDYIWLNLSDQTRPGKPVIVMGINTGEIYEIVRCLYDTRYEITIKGGRAEVLSRSFYDRAKDSFCCEGREVGDIFDKWIIFFGFTFEKSSGPVCPLPRYVIESKYCLHFLCLFSFLRDGPDYEPELRQIIETIRVAE